MRHTPRLLLYSYYNAGSVNRTELVSSRTTTQGCGITHSSLSCPTPLAGQAQTTTIASGGHDGGFRSPNSFKSFAWSMSLAEDEAKQNMKVSTARMKWRGICVEDVGRLSKLFDDVEGLTS